MKIKIMADLVSVTVFDKKDKETKEFTGEKGLKHIALLTDKTEGSPLSGEVIRPYLAAEYSGPFDFGDFNRLQPVEAELELTVFEGKESYKLLNLTKVEKKK